VLLGDGQEVGGGSWGGVSFYAGTQGRSFFLNHLFPCLLKVLGEDELRGRFLGFLKNCLKAVEPIRGLLSQVSTQNDPRTLGLPSAAEKSMEVPGGKDLSP